MRNGKWGGLWRVAALAAICGSAGPAAQDQEPPVFRSGTVFVSVDVHPLRDGRPIEGLTPADIEVFEDGTRQQIETFEFIRFDTAVLDGDRVDPTSVADSERQAADPRNRLFVVYFDAYHARVEDAARLGAPVRTFLERTIGPRDLFGVMTPQTPPSRLTFGRRLEALDRDLDEFWRIVQFDREGRVPRDAVEQRLIECPAVGGAVQQILRLHREDALLTNLEGLMHRLAGIREERKNILFLSNGWRPSDDAPELMAFGSGSVPVVGVGPTGRLGAGSQQPFGGERTWCDDQLARLAGGRYQQRFRDLLELARRSNVTFYPVNVAGLEVAPAGGARETLRTLAENTQGRAVVDTNDLTSGVRGVTDSLSAYYLVGYYSTNPAVDGRYRAIEVRVRQPDVSVTARPGYFAPTPEMVAAATARPPAGPTPVDEALSHLARARADTDLFVYGVRREGSLAIVAELSARAAGAGRWPDGARLEITVSPASGAEVAAEGRIEAGERATVVEVPMAADETGPWRVTVRALGGPETLDGTDDVPGAERHLLGGPVPYRASPSPRSTPRPVADFQYRREERLHVEWPLLGALDTRAARLLDREGAPLPIEPVLGESHDGTGPMVTVGVLLSALAPGDYVLELTGTGAGVSDRSLLAFRVVR